MSGCGVTYYSAKRKAICFEPETDKDLDRLKDLLRELREDGQENRIIRLEYGKWLILLSGD